MTNEYMTNAKEEFLEMIKGKSKIKCASIQYKKSYDELCQKTLKINYTEEDYQLFLKPFYFNYDAGYGIQELDGTIWLEDGTWFTRDEYDGSEWWLFHILSDIPEECL